MPQFIALTLGTITLLFAFRWVRRELDRVTATMSRTDRRVRKAQSERIPQLAFDGKDGVYRLVHD